MITVEGDMVMTRENSKQSNVDMLVKCGADIKWAVGTQALPPPSSFIKCLDDFSKVTSQGSYFNLCGFVHSWSSETVYVQSEPELKYQFVLEDKSGTQLPVSINMYFKVVCQ